jgi:lipoprotein-anchoring transpeptidase ErfK/SrfK
MGRATWYEVLVEIKEGFAMDRSMRICVLLILVASLTGSLFITASSARAQAQDYASMNNGTHVVESGQTLNEIARLYGTDVKTLRQLNNLDDADLLHVGQRLLVSEGESWNQPVYEEGDSWEKEESYARPQEQNRQTGQEVRKNTPTAGEVSWSEPYAEEYTGDYEGTETQEESYAPHSSSQQGQSYPQGRSYEPQDSGAAWSYPAGNSEQDRAYAQEGNVQGRSYEPLSEKELTGEKWVDIDLGDQQMTVYQGDTAVRFFWISSGSSSTPTVKGSFRTYARTPLQDMSGGSQAAGDYYFQADVPWVQYFFEDYAIHGAYWHNSFGRPIGHGCINMRVEDSQWLYEWAGATGMRVEVHD